MDQIVAVVEKTVVAAERAVAETAAAVGVEIAAGESFGSEIAADQNLAAAAGS